MTHKPILSSKKRELLAQMLKAQGFSEQPAGIHPRPGDRTTAPLSFAQQRLWFLHQLKPTSSAYNLLLPFRLEGALDTVALERAFSAVVERHEVLRTTFQLSGGQPLQVIAPQLPVTFKVEDLRGLSPTAQDAEVKWLAAEEAGRPFDLAHGPLIRLRRVCLSESVHVLFVSLHHSVFDGWSLQVLLQDLARFYMAYRADQTPEMSALPIQYADFAYWQRTTFQTEALQKQITYWQTKLGGTLPVMELPTDHPRPAVQTFRGAYLPLRLPIPLKEALQTLSQQAGVTLFTTCLAAFKILLARYTGQTDIIVGIPTAGRGRPEVRELIGAFINMLVLRTDLREAGKPTFREVLNRVRTVTAEAYAHQDVSFEQLVEILQPTRDLSRNPLFNVGFAMNDLEADLALPGLKITELSYEHDHSKFDLMLDLVETSQGLSGGIEYNTDLFDEATIERLKGHFQTLLEGVVAEPGQRLSQLPLLTPAEREQVLVTWNNPPVEFPLDGCLHELFTTQAERTPDAIAVVLGADQITYGELNARANQLARYLQKLGVGPDGLVGLCLERSIEIVVGIVGILKAGGAYLPLDPSYPAERLAYMLEDSGARVLLTQSRLLAEGGRWPLVMTHQPPTTICLDADWETITNNQQLATSNQPPTPDSLAYVIYTSGSTGRPKGTAISHANVARLLRAAEAWFHFDARDVWTLFHSYAFDFSVWELWGALAYGGRLVVVPYETSRSPEVFYDVLGAQGVTVLNQTPSAFQPLSQVALARDQRADNLRLVIFGGEKLEVPSLGPWFERFGDQQPQLVNMYGITETTVHVTYRPLGLPDVSGADGSVIGRAIPDLQLYVLDAQLQPVPIGIPGELYVGGAGLARGYLGRPELTAERFIPNPFIEIGDERRKTKDEGKNIRPSSFVLRLYKTGDLARYRPSGELEYLGRIDQQVKLRGFRIELGEIEAVLTQHPAVRANVVIAQDHHAGKQLVAYLVAEPMTTPRELRNFLIQQVPDYMLPSAFVFLDALPLTPNGKIDRRALSAVEGPAPDQAQSIPGEAYLAPRTPVEELLAGLWANVLGRSPIGIYDNFFESGGHSLLATQVIARIRETFQVELPLRSLFESPTIAGLAEQIELARRDNASESAPPLQPTAREGALPLSFTQQRLWFLDQLTPDSAAYNSPLAVRLTGELNLAALTAGLADIVQRHEILRTVFINVAGQPAQVIQSFTQSALPVVDLTPLPAVEREPEAQRLAFVEANQPFDLARGPLLRTQVLCLGTAEHILLLTLHHIVADGWSMGVALRELAALYTAYVEDKPARLADLPLQYADYAAWQQTWLEGKTFETQLNYWRTQLAGVSVLELPTDHPRPAMQTFQGATYSWTLSRELTAQLKTLSRREGVTLFMLLLAAFQTLLARYTGQTDIAVGSPIANRNRTQLEGLIGYFANTLVLRSDLREAGAPTFREFLARVRETTLNAYAHQDVPFEKIVEVLQPARDLSHNPLFQALFALHNLPQVPPMNLGEAALSLSPTPRTTARFDLSLDLQEDGDQLSGFWEYNTDLFAAETLARLAAHFEMLLEGLATDPTQRLSQLPLLTPAERQQTLYDWNATETDYETDICLHQLIERQAEQSPDAVAVVCPVEQLENGAAEQLTYGALNTRAKQLARYLQQLGVKSGDCVGLCVERSLAMVVGLLGILKAGAAYVPLDPSYPAERLAFMLADARISIVVTKSQWQRTKDEGPLRETKDEPSAISHQPFAICLDTDWPAIAKSLAPNPQPPVPDSLAYLIYTSGSTGRPKGVMIAHRSVVQLLTTTRPSFNFGAQDVWTVFHSYAFDFSVWEIWGCLAAGGRLVIVPPVIAQAPETFSALVREQHVTVLNQTPSALRQFIEQEDVTGRSGWEQLRLIVCGGEAFPPELAPAVAGWPVWNFYGPTEATVWASSAPLQADEAAQGRVSIGRPLPNTQLYVLDEHLQPTPPGVLGELYIGGDGLALGYHGRPGLTAEKFVPNPFVTEDKGRTTKDEGKSFRPSSFVLRLYKTGDLARYLPNGHIEFVGRRDHQVKVRGYRIELGEIEAALAQHPALRASVVTAQAWGAGENRLVAYVVAAGEEDGRQRETGDGGRWTAAREEHSPTTVVRRPSSVELRAFLKAHLPDYMLPATFVFLEALPLTPNGKIDRQALALSKAEGLSTSEADNAYVAPRTDTEAMLSQICSELLGVKPMGLYDNFFELGGHSLLATRVVVKLREAFGVELPLRALFEHPTLADLAEQIDQRRSASLIPADSDRLAALLAQVQSLSDQEVNALLNEEE